MHERALLADSLHARRMPTPLAPAQLRSSVHSHSAAAAAMAACNRSNFALTAHTCVLQQSDTRGRERGQQLTTLVCCSEFFFNLQQRVISESPVASADSICFGLHSKGECMDVESGKLRT